MRARLDRAARFLLVTATLSVVAFALQCPAISVDDSPSYLDPARSWAAGHGLRDDDRPLESRLPLYPLVLGLLTLLVGGSPSAISVLNAGFHVSAVLVVRHVLRRRMGAVGADLVAAAAMAYLPLVTATALVLQESLLSLLLAIAFAAIWRAIETGAIGWSAAAGAALGLSGLAKVTALPLLLPAAALIAPGRPRKGPISAAGRDRTRGLACALALVLAAVAMLAPWAVRNQLVLGRFEVTNANGGQTFLGGTVSNRVSDWACLPEYIAARRAWEEEDHVVYPRLDGYLYRVGLRRIADAPGHWLLLVAERIARFILPARHWLVAVGLARPGTFPAWYVLATLFNLALFVGAGRSAVLAVRTHDLPLLAGPLIVFGHQLVYALTYVSPRYGVTVGPVLFGAAGLAIGGIPSRSSDGG